MPRKVLTPLCFFFFGALGSSAQERLTDTAGLQVLQPIEIRAIRAATEAPFAKTDISGAEVQKANLGQDLPYLLQYTPSVVVSSDAGAGVGYTGIRIRGTDVTRINVTLNGIPVNDAESQGSFFVDLPDLSSSVSSIQIQRGVGTSTNGAGAFGATMSISNTTQMEKAGAELKLGTGSFNTQKYTLAAGTGLLDKGWQFDLRLSRIHSDGYIDRSSSDLAALQLLAGWKIDPTTSLRFMMLQGKEKTGQAWNGVSEQMLKVDRTWNELGLKPDSSAYGNQTDNYRQNYYQLFLSHEFSTHLSGSLAAFLTRGLGYYEEYRAGEDLSSYGLADSLRNSSDLVRQLWLDNYYYGSLFSLLYRKGGVDLTFGGGLMQYRGRHYGLIKWAEANVPVDYRWYNLDALKTDLNLFVKAQKTFRSLSVYGDIQWRKVHYEINGFRKNPLLRPDNEYSFLNPKVGLSLKLVNRAAEQQRVYLSFAVANKEPNRDDFEAGAAEMPRPERLYDLEAGYELRRQSWQAALNLFYMDYQDQLVLTGRINDVGAYVRTNVPKSYRRGLELSLGLQPASWISVQANLTWSQNKIQEFTEYIDNYDTNIQAQVLHKNTDIAFSPEIISGASVSITPFQHLSGGQHLEFVLAQKYVGRQYLDNTSDAERSLKPFLLHDLRVQYTRRLAPFREAGLSLALNNIFDRLYESNGYTFSYIYGNQLTTQNYYFPQAGFNWLLGLTLKW